MRCFHSQFFWCACPAVQTLSFPLQCGVAPSGSCFWYSCGRTRFCSVLHRLKAHPRSLSLLGSSPALPAGSSSGCLFFLSLPLHILGSTFTSAHTWLPLSSSWAEAQVRERQTFGNSCLSSEAHTVETACLMCSSWCSTNLSLSLFFSFPLVSLILSLLQSACTASLRKTACSLTS